MLTGSKIGQVVAGQDPLWLAWITDLNNLLANGDTKAYNDLLNNVVPGSFQSWTSYRFNSSINGYCFRDVP